LAAIETLLTGFALFHELVLGVINAPCPICKSKENDLLRKLAAKYQFEQTYGKQRPKRRRK